MNTRKMLEQVFAAQQDAWAADQLVRAYLPFIRSETAKFIHRIPQEGIDDELSIAMFAFHEAVMAYQKDRGSFVSFASLIIRNRLIDFQRKEEKYHKNLSLTQTYEDSDRSDSLLDQLDTGYDEIEEKQIRSATREEIMEFAAQLADFGLSLSDIADNCPKQDRTLKACHACLAYAKKNPELLTQLVSTKKLPLAALSSGSKIERKTLERHRKYLVAILLAYTNGFEIIRGHLCQIAPPKVERSAL